MFIDNYEKSERVRFELEEPNKYFVYFLKNENKVVYVGLTTSMYARISVHKRDKKFDEVEYIEVPGKRAAFIEFYFIKKYMPKYNKGIYPVNGYGSYDTLERPTSFPKKYLKAFIYVYDLKPLAIIDSERHFSQKYFEEKWSEVYDSYRALTKEEKKELYEEYEKLDISEMDRELNN